MNSVCWFGELARARSLGHAYFSKLKSSQNKLKFEKQAQAELFETIHSVFVKKITIHTNLEHISYLWISVRNVCLMIIV